MWALYFLKRCTCTINNHNKSRNHNAKTDTKQVYNENHENVIISKVAAYML